jgi:hypothetical protein
MKVFASEIIHKSTSKNLVIQYENNIKRTDVSFNTSGLEEYPEQISPGAAVKESLHGSSASTRWFRDAIPDDKEA